jgi:hypothetical protein
MRTLTTLLAASLVALPMVVTAPQSADAGKRGRNIAIGAAAVIAGAAILSGAARAERRREYYGYRRGYYRHSCSELYDRCNYGQDWACERFDDRGC